MTTLPIYLAIPLASSLKVASRLSVLEWTPELIAKEDFFEGDVQIVDGGIPASLATQQ